MCGPLVMSIPFGHSKSPTFFAILYMLAKALSYALIGWLVGALNIGTQLFEYQQVISVVIGLIIIIATLTPFLKQKFQLRFLNKISAQVFVKLQQQKKWYQYLLMGLVNGWLPCGMVFIALSTTLLTDNVWSSAISMFLFGIGTSPILLSVILFNTKLNLNKRVQFKQFSKIATVTIAILLIFRGLNLGIPYLSPHFDATAQEATPSCCH